MKRLIYLIVSSMLFTNCATLTKTQIESVNQFAKSTSEFSDYPSKIMEEMAEIRFKRGIYFANTLSVPELHVGELDSVYSQWRSDYQLSKKVDITFQIIDKYGQSLALLSADKYATDLEKQAKNFGVNIDTLIAINNRMEGTTKVPVGIGASIGQLIVFGGKQYTRIKQGREIKKFVSQADTLIAVMTNNLLEYLQSSSINELIEGEEREITSNYLSYLRQNTNVPISSELDYMEMKKKVDKLKELQQQTIKATIKLRKAHRKLLENLQKKKKLKDAIDEVQTLNEDIKALQKTIESIERIEENKE